MGTSLGLGTLALSLSNEFAAIHTVEGCPNTLNKAQEYFEKFNCTIFKYINSFSVNSLNPEISGQKNMI